jgi:D-alanyl-D-alanine carboxypeptidase (penicillin-binding protein 5/6)
VVTLMNSPHGITEDASSLLDWGFLHYDVLNPIGTLVKPAVPVPATGKSREVERKSATGPSLPKRSRTVLASGQAVQAIVFRIPVWAYAAPPILLLSLFLRRPRALRIRNRSRRH